MNCKRINTLFLKIFNIRSTRRRYVITQTSNGVKYFYKGKDSKWTPMVEGAKHYKKKPTFVWILNYYYKVEEYYKK